jgi:hypothetical protein
VEGPRVPSKSLRFVTDILKQYTQGPSTALRFGRDDKILGILNPKASRSRNSQVSQMRRDLGHPFRGNANEIPRAKC